MEKNLKPVSTEPPRSALSSGTVANWADILKAKTLQEAGAIQKLTENELAQHQQNLIDLSQNALYSTRDVIQAQVSQIEQALAGTTRRVIDAMTVPEQQITAALYQGAEQIQQQTEVLNKTLDAMNSKIKTSLGQATTALQVQQSDLTSEVSTQTKRLLLFLKVPVLVTFLAVLIVCLILCAGTWAWTTYRLEQLDQREAQAAQSLAQTQQTINQLTQQFCRTPAGLKTCQKQQ